MQEEGGSFVFGVDCTAVLETEGAESSLLECKRRIVQVVISLAVTSLTETNAIEQ